MNDLVNIQELDKKNIVVCCESFYIIYQWLSLLVNAKNSTLDKVNPSIPVRYS